MKRLLTVLLMAFALSPSVNAQLSNITEAEAGLRCSAFFIEAHSIGVFEWERFSIPAPGIAKLDAMGYQVKDVSLGFDGRHGLRYFANNRGFSEKLLTTVLPCLIQKKSGTTPESPTSVERQKEQTLQPDGGRQNSAVAAMRTADAEMWTERAVKAGFNVKYAPCRNGAALCGEFQGEDALPYVQKIYGDTESSRELAQKGYTALLLRNTPKDQKNQQYFGMKPTPQGWESLPDIQEKQ